MPTQTVVYNAPPTGRLFHAAGDKFVRGLMGPIGSGKSTICCAEIMSRAQRQSPGLDGVRRSKWAIIRNTYPELKRTTIKTWMNWFGDFTELRFDHPITGRVRRAFGDGTVTDLELEFLALDNLSDSGKLKSLELTGVWVNEAREVPWEIITELPTRCRRYPNSTMQGHWSWSGMIMDTNPPDDSSDWYKTFEEACPSNWSLFRQPGALTPVRVGKEWRYDRNPLAENLENLKEFGNPNSSGYDYYELAIGLERNADGSQKGFSYSKPHGWINNMMCGQYGFSLGGKAIYEGVWNDDIHFSKEELVPFRGLPIRLGWDFGLSPALVVGQITPRGALWILDEVVGEDTGFLRFLKEQAIPLLQNRYSGFQILSHGDPSGVSRGRDEKSCLTDLNSSGYPTEAASTNNFLPRRDSVVSFLTRNLGSEPGFLLSNKCPVLRRAFNGGYQYRRMATGVHSDEAMKNSYSHPSDALQYLCLGAQERRTRFMSRRIVTGQRSTWGAVT